MDESDAESDDSMLEGMWDNIAIEQEAMKQGGKPRKKQKTEQELKRANFRRKQKLQHKRVEVMSLRRAEKEREVNPLIDLLGINIELTDGSSEEEDLVSDATDSKKKVKKGILNRKALKFKNESHSPSPEANIKTERTDEDVKPVIDVKPSPVELQDSATESESEPEEDFRAQERREAAMLYAKRAAPQPVASTSKRKVEDMAADLTDEEGDSHFAAKNENGTTPASSQSQPVVERGIRPSFGHRTDPKLNYPLYLGSDQQNRSISIPASVNRYLRDYQREGARFFYDHFAKGEGGILGDDMGLGKTIQVISFLSAIMRRTGKKEDDYERRARHVRRNGSPLKPTELGPTCLILAPSSVVYNWEREINTWGYFETRIYRGTKDERKTVMRAFRKGFVDIVICSHETARESIGDLEDVDFSCVVVDECHKLKNPKAKLTQAFKKFLTLCRFGLTGTAMQNKYGELWTLLDWAFPDRMGSDSDWKAWVTDPISRGQKHDANMEELAVGRERALELVTNLLPKFFLRRTKALIADQLPKKIDRVVFCPLADQQIEAYRRLLSSEEKMIEGALCFGEYSQAELALRLPLQKGNCCYRGWERLIFPCMMLLQKVANHLCLIYPDKNDLQRNSKKYQKDQEWIRVAFPTDYARRQAGFVAEQDKELCGKWRVLTDLLKIWHKDKAKVLLFSRSKPLLTAMEHWLAEDYPDQALRLDGDTPTERRLGLCDKFNDDPEISFFVISTMAGGVGLNLTGASKVVIFDPNWNPAHDSQAQDRAYRWGQTRDVDVYRLIGAGSLEELVYTRVRHTHLCLSTQSHVCQQIYKQQQNQIAYNASAERRYFQGVQGVKGEEGELWGVKNIFRLRDESTATDEAVRSGDGVSRTTTSAAHSIIEQCNMAELGYALNKFGEVDEDEAANPDKEQSALVAEQERQFEQAIVSANKGSGSGTVKAEKKADAISEILSRNGINYTHHNAHVVGQSAIEQDISKNAVDIHKAKRARKNARLGGDAYQPAYEAIKLKSKGKTEEDDDDKPAQWPPPRKAKDTSVKQETRVMKPRQNLQALMDQVGTDYTVEELVSAAGYSTLNEFTLYLFSLDVPGQKRVLADAQRVLKRK